AGISGGRNFGTRIQSGFRRRVAKFGRKGRVLGAPQFRFDLKFSSGRLKCTPGRKGWPQKWRIFPGNLCPVPREVHESFPRWSSKTRENLAKSTHAYAG